MSRADSALALALAVFCTIVAPCLADDAAAAEWGAPFSIRRGSGNLTFQSVWHDPAGIRFRIASKENPAHEVSVRLSPASCSVRAVPDTRPHGATADLALNPPLAPGNESTITMTIKFRPCFWSLYAGQRLLARFPAPFAAPATLRQPANQSLKAPDEQPFFQKTARQHFHDDFMVAEGDDASLGAWSRIRGTWNIHSAQDDAIAQGTARERKRLRPAYSPNFYSLVGAGPRAVMVSGYDFWDHYRVQAAVQPQHGEAGLIFYYRAPGDHYAFTITSDRDPGRPPVVRLWQAQGGAAAEHVNVLAAARLHTAGRQWLLMRVSVSPGRVRCMVDNTTIFDVGLEPGVGGKFGLFADTSAGARFDDVRADTGTDIDLEAVERIRLYTLDQTGEFPAGPGPTLSPSQAGTSQSLVFGDVHHDPHLFAATFKGKAQGGLTGLLFAYQGKEAPCFRFTRRQGSAGEVFTLDRIEPRSTNVVETSRRPPAAQDTATLMADCTEEGRIRLYRNDELVVIHHTDLDLSGASGIFVGPDTEVSVSRLLYAWQRPNLYRSRFEKNRLFAADLYMRHWSSPEGEWVPDSEGRLWHKSDFFGRFLLHMPLVPDTEIHLGVPDEDLQGSVVIQLSGYKAAVLEGKTRTDAVDIEGDWFEVHRENRWIWLTSSRGLLLRHELSGPLQGTRMRITGFSMDDLAQSYTERYRVKDYLFTEAPHAWMQNGGTWQVVNRFSCYPRWSHMNGQATDGFGAMWSKYEFGGDFCVEMYVGTRGTSHEFYERCGDWNATIMSRETTPSQGYSVTCTAWDFDLSQRYTSLYRQGELWQRSDVYAGPRYRDGNKRKLHHPLVTRGRDVHGAWYYIKFRKSGNRLEYFFDNECIFSCEDDTPLEHGRFGLWTFMNSIMVARVKVAAEQITPLAVSFDLLDPAAGRDDRAVRSTRRWSVKDTTGYCHLDDHRAEDGESYFTVTNLLGSGKMHVRYAAAAANYAQVAGWRFQVKRTPRACFNFHYTIGRRSGHGTYQPLRHFFHRLSGTDFSKGDYTMSGQTHVPGAAEGGPGWHEKGAWTPVTVWLPTVGVDGVGQDPMLAVRAEGFGNLQASYTAQGLTGNGPGESYAVKGFSSIPYQAPSPPPNITCAWHPTLPGAIVLTSDAPTPDRRFAAANVAVAGRPLPFHATEEGVRVGYLPRTAALTAERGPVKVRVVTADKSLDFELPWDAGRVPQGPVLVDLQARTPCFENFESGNDGRQLLKDTSRMSVRQDDPVMANYLHVFNTQLDQRLKTEFSVRLNLSRYPLVQFSYRAQELPPVSLALGKRHIVHLSENLEAARPARYALPLTGDGQWHTWCGVVADSVGNTDFSPDIFLTPTFGLGSYRKVDQTFKFSSWDLDNLVVGPAVASDTLLRVTPRYVDADGVDRVLLATHAGPEPYDALSPATRKALKWKPVPHQQPVTPSLDDAPDGPCHMLLKAVDRRGVESRVTDLPFLLDRRAPECSGKTVQSRDPLSNGSLLHLAFRTHGGSPLDLEKLNLVWNGQTMRLDRLLNTFTHTPAENRIVLNWPYILRNKLNVASHGDVMRLEVSQIRDGAGNAAPAFSVPMEVNVEQDETGPTLLPVRFPEAVCFGSCWYGRPDRPVFFSWARTNEVKLHHPWQKEPFVSTVSEEVYGFYWLTFRSKTNPWRLDKYPFITFRVRRRGIDEDERISIKLYSDDGVFEIALTEKLTEHYLNDDAVRIPHPVQWQENTWQDVVLDLRKLLEPHGGTRGRSVRALWFVRDHTPDRVPLDLKDFYVHGLWQPSDVVHLDAYDAGGIDGAEWRIVDPAGKVAGSGTLDDLRVLPAALKAPGTPHAWLEVRVMDRAGNRSLPVRLPMVQD